MVPGDLRDALAAELDPSPDPRPAPGDRLAAVLVPIIVSPAPSIVFTRRAADLSRHPGEISFPGGLVEPGETLVAAALREAREEIDLDPALPDVVGALSPVHTHVSEILVTPFEGLLDGAFVWGATGAMLHELLEIVRGHASWIL